MFDRWISKSFNFGERVVVVKCVDVELNDETIPSTRFVLLVLWPFPSKERNRGLIVVLATWSPIFFPKWKQITVRWLTAIQFNTEINMGLHLYRFVYITDSQRWMASVCSICNVDDLKVYFHRYTYSFYFVFVILIGIARLSCTNTVEQIKENRTFWAIITKLTKSYEIRTI